MRVRIREQVRRDGWKKRQNLIPSRFLNICLLAPKIREAAAAHMLIRAVINHSSHCVCVCVCM